MTAPEPPLPVVTLYAANPNDRCTANGCGDQATDRLCSCHGRRCPEHAVHELTAREAS